MGASSRWSPYVILCIAPHSATLKQKGSVRKADDNKVRTFNEDMGEVLDRLREAEELMGRFLSSPPEAPLPAWAPQLVESGSSPSAASVRISRRV
jgi:hypothetical protein